MAFSGHEHLPAVFTVGGDPDCGRVWHGVFDVAGSEHLAVVADFYQGVDQEGPYGVPAGGGRL